MPRTRERTVSAVPGSRRPGARTPGGDPGGRSPAGRGCPRLSGRGVCLSERPGLGSSGVNLPEAGPFLGPPLPDEQRRPAPACPSRGWPRGEPPVLPRVVRGRGGWRGCGASGDLSPACVRPRAVAWTHPRRRAGWGPPRGWTGGRGRAGPGGRGSCGTAGGGARDAPSPAPGGGRAGPCGGSPAARADSLRGGRPARGILSSSRSSLLRNTAPGPCGLIGRWA